MMKKDEKSASSLAFDFVLCHVIFKVLGRDGLGIEIALNEITFGGFEEIHLLLRLDAFGDNRHVKRFGKVNDVLHDNIGAV